MRILILNWKDIKHPEAGGAEIVTHQYANHLVKSGHYVTLFTSSFGGAKAEEIIDGVRILRKGTIYTVNLWAALVYFTRLKYETDLVIDQIHGIPFFTPLYVRKPTLAWIHEVAGDIWRKEFPFPIAIIGILTEKIYFSLYRNVTFLTDSLSTKKELISCGVNTNRIKVIPLTIDRPVKIRQRKTKYPTLIYVGRLTPMKRVEFLIQSTNLIKSMFPRLKTLIIGDGKLYYVRKLKYLVRELNLESSVRFLGRVTESQKWRLLATSWLHVHPSLKEGFGLNVLEAVHLGTPTISFDVGGLRDVIQNGRTGVIVKEETPQALADTIEQMLKEPERLTRLSRNALKWSKKLPTWETQSKRLVSLLDRLMKHSQ